MKELSKEEKARRYDEAIEVIRKCKTDKYGCIVGIKSSDLFPELKESEDEKIRKEIKIILANTDFSQFALDYTFADMIAWLEKQGENHIVNNNEMVKPTTDKVEPKFHEGDWVVLSTSDGEKVVQIDSIEYFKSGEPRYITSEGRWFGNGTTAHLWTIQDAKDGDVLMANAPFIFNGNLEGGVGCPGAHCGINTLGNFQISKGKKRWTSHITTPATKEQRDTLMKAMADAGYKWDAEKKKLKKIEQKPVLDVEIPFGAKDSELWEHRIVIPEGYYVSIEGNLIVIRRGEKPTDETLYPETLEKAIDLYYYSYGNGEGEFEHLSLERFRDIVHTFVNDYGQKPAWSEEDERKRKHCIVFLNHPEMIVATPTVAKGCKDWLKSLKDRVQLKQEWKQENTGDLNVFENAMMHIANSFFGQYAGLDPNDTNAIKEQANLLLELVPNKEWSEEDENTIKDIIEDLEYAERKGYVLKNHTFPKEINWLKSLKERYIWKPSDEHYELEEFAKIVRGNLTGISKAVQGLFEDKYLQLTGNKMYGGFKD